MSNQTVPAEERKLDKKKDIVPFNKQSPYHWKNCPVEDLLRWYDEIQLHLPPLKLSEMNLEKELLLQFHTVRALQTAVMDDNEIPVNQRAQVANTVASSMKQLADLQEMVYRTERHKNIESLLIKHLSKLPEEAAQVFLNEYRLILKQYA